MVRVQVTRGSQNRVTQNISRTAFRTSQSSLKKEVLTEIKEQLRTAHPCKVGSEEKYFAWLGDNLLNKYQKLLPHCQHNSEVIILNDLKERFEKIRNNELPDYNQTLAYSICQELGIQHIWHGQEMPRLTY